MNVKGFRRQYVDVVRERVLGGDVGGLLDLGMRWLGTAIARPSKRTLVGPTLGTLIVTYRCNLRCRVCDLPQRAAAKRRGGEHELDTAGLAAVLRDMKAIGVAGVGVTGGEPMLRPDLQALLSYGSRLGLHMHLNTDGFGVAGAARGLLATGVRSVNVSLDGATAAEHDRIRGRGGAYDDAVSALGALAAARQRRPWPRLTAVTVLTRRRLAQVEEVARRALDAGADRLGVIPVHDFGQGETAPDDTDVGRALEVLRRLQSDGVLDNSPAYLELLPLALRGEESPLVCYAPYASVVVDCYGDVYPCFPLMAGQEPVGRIPLGKLWRSAGYQRTRDELRSCKRCLWNCHTEMNLTLPQARSRSAG